MTTFDGEQSAPAKINDVSVDSAAAPPALGRALLLSLQPRFAEAILSGAKTVELRRKAPTLDPDAEVILYSSTPVKAIVGIAYLSEIARLDPPELWDRHGSRSGVTSGEFDSYFDGTDIAYGLFLGHARTATRPVPLTTLRALGITPPQSWRYLDAATTKDLRTRMRPAEVRATKRRRA